MVCPRCQHLHRFQTLEEAWQVIAAFIDRYNHEWLIERLGYRTPAEARTEGRRARARIQPIRLAAEGRSASKSPSEEVAFPETTHSHVSRVSGEPGAVFIRHARRTTDGSLNVWRSSSSSRSPERDRRRSGPRLRPRVRSRTRGTLTGGGTDTLSAMFYQAQPAMVLVERGGDASGLPRHGGQRAKSQGPDLMFWHARGRRR
jgi:hypothetical protein